MTRIRIDTMRLGSTVLFGDHRLVRVLVARNRSHVYFCEIELTRF